MSIENQSPEDSNTGSQKAVNPKAEFVTGTFERYSYGFYFFGQLIFYIIVTNFLALYLTDSGIPAVVVGGIFAMIFQGADFGAIMHIGRRGLAPTAVHCAAEFAAQCEAGSHAGFYPYRFDFGSDTLNTLLRRGGIYGKMYAVGLVIIAMCFGGVMEKSRQLEVVVDKIIQWFVRGTTSLVTATVGVTIISNATMADQYLGLIMPAKMFATAYRNRGFHPKMLSAAVDGPGTLSSALIPWNTCGVYMASVLGVSAFAYIPFAFFNWSVPIVVIILAATGKFTVMLRDDPTTVTTSYEEMYKDSPLPAELQ